MEASRFKATDLVESYDDLIQGICWDDSEDKEAALAGGVYVTCGGIWRREEDNQWRFWEDQAVVEALNGGPL